MAGVDIRATQELMGHKTVVMTMRYAHLAPAHLHSAVEKLAGYNSRGRRGRRKTRLARLLVTTSVSRLTNDS